MSFLALMSQGARCTIVAEAGVNHDGRFDRAVELVEAAADAGADLVKFQLFRADEVASELAPKARYQLRTTGDAPQVEMLRQLELPPEAFPELLREARRHGLGFLATCYATEELDLLDDAGVEAFKFASAQIVELPLLAHAARKGRPLIISTGMATTDEIAEALETIRAAGNPPVVLLQCTTSYPARLDEVNLRAMATLRDSFGCPVGFSDHTDGDAAAVAAVALGAVLLEKHLTLDCSLPGPDHAASLEPAQFAAMVQRVRAAEAALGAAEKAVAPSERENVSAMRRSLFAVADIAAGATIRAEQIGMRRPFVGLPPRHLPEVVGSVARVEIARGTPITRDLLA
jgi:N-acetylneuraminate synthase/N,N'-diacetyllegionaminate synthase